MNIENQLSADHEALAAIARTLGDAKVTHEGDSLEASIDGAPEFRVQLGEDRLYRGTDRDGLTFQGYVDGDWVGEAVTGAQLAAHLATTILASRKG